MVRDVPKYQVRPDIRTPFGDIYINAGSGPIEGAEEKYADQNILQLVKDIGLKKLTSRRDSSKDYGEGRFAYQLNNGQEDVEVQMPGLPLEMVRFVDEKGQKISDFPRLYVIGGSWVWSYAVDIIKRAFETTPQE